MLRTAALVRAGLLLGLVLAACRSPGESPEPRGGDLVARLVARNDEGIPDQLARQQLVPADPAFGGIRGADGLYFPGAASGFLRDLSAAYVSPQSRHCRSPRLLAAMDAAARFLLAVQHEDGTVDLPTTNFHSPPDTGFVLEWVCAAATVLRDAADPAAAPVLDKLLRFIRRAADALAVGGVHTPNHRWVICMALARANTLVPDARYVARIDTWLAEGVDIDPDGQFTERSTTIYSPLTDRCLITVARLLDRPELLEPVRRNLEMSLCYLHADGQVATEGSRRQDQYQRGSMRAYHYPYRYLALRDDNGRFAAVARRLEAEASARLADDLIYFLESPELGATLPAAAPLPTDFERHFPHSGLVRVRRGELSATILEDNPTFFSLHVGRAAVAVRFASAFFGKGQFVGAGLHAEDGTWVLRQELTGPYWQPMPEEHRRADGNWLLMDKDLRPTSEVQQLVSCVGIREADGGFDLEVDVRGTDGVPLAIELACPTDCAVGGAVTVADEPDRWLAADDRFRITSGTDHIELQTGAATHRWVQLRGALPKLPGKSVYVTGLTPFRRTLRFRR